MRRAKTSAPFLLALTLALLAPGLGHAAKLQWDQTEARLEMTPGQESVEASFKVTNKGDETVRIARIKTSCGCTGSVVDQTIIRPGDTTEIIGRFRKGNRQGRNRSKLQVFLEGRTNAVATLHMIIDIPTLIAVRPSIVFWSPRTDETPRQVRLDLDERYIDSIESIAYDESLLELTAKPDPREKADRILSIVPKDFSKPIRTTVKLVGHGPKERKAEAKVLVYVQP